MLVAVAFLSLRYSNLLLSLGRVLLLNPDSLAESEIRSEVRLAFTLRGLNGWSLLYGAFGKFEYTFFAYAVQSMSIYVVAVTYEIWPMVMILLMATLFSGDLQYRKTGIGLFSMLGLCLVGFALVLSSELPNLSGEVHHYGVVLALFAALIAGSHNAVLFRWGFNLRDRLNRVGVSSGSGESMTVFCTVLGHAISQFVCLFASLAIGLAIGEEMEWKLFALAIGGGALSSGVGGLFFRMANSVSTSLGVNAISYTTPIFALVWLLLFSEANVVRVDYLVIGAAAIITANLLINFEAEIRWGFKALILSLGVCGAVVYLRDGVFDFRGVDQWNWAGSGYFESITLAATVFTLLLAFRVARLVGRTTEEDNRIFIMYRKLDMLARGDVISGEVCDYVLDIDRARNNSAMEKDAYTRALGLIAGVDPRALDEADRQLLSDAEANLDALARSKQVDIHLGEQFALGIFAAITIELALFSRPPQVEGWTRLMVDLFAMLIAAVVVFLLFHIQDLQRERDGRKLEALERVKGRPLHSVRFLDTGERSFNQWLSIVVGAGIVLTYGGLLAHKWLGWFA